MTNQIEEETMMDLALDFSEFVKELEAKANEKQRKEIQ